MGQGNGHDGNVISITRGRANLAGYQYLLLPGNCPPNFSKVELHNKAFNQWRDFWMGVFKQISGEKVRAEDFWRQRIICLLMKDSDIAAIHLYSFFHLDSEAALSHSYFRINYTDITLRRLRKSGIETVMSMEYLTVNPEFRNNVIGFPIASVILGLGCKVLEQSGYDAAIGPCRRDVKVDSKVAEFGAIPFSDEYIHHGVPVINMMLPSSSLKTHPDPKVSQTVNNLWNSHQDLSEYNFNKNIKKQAA